MALKKICRVSVLLYLYPMNILQNDIKSIGVFCGSSMGTNNAYKEAATRMGMLMAAQEIRLIYGGGNVGLMGVIADAIIENGGHATGVITQHLADVELAHNGVQELIVVESMSERKNKIVALSDAFIAMPGGLGTFDELFEALTLCQLQLIKKPIGLLNTAHFFDALIHMVNHSIAEGFMRDRHRDFFVEDADETRLLEKLRCHQPPESRKWLENFNKEKH